MALGKGKYDDLCTYAREQSKATGACLMIFGGEAGWGFSIQAPPYAMIELPKLLRHMADVVEADHAEGYCGRNNTTSKENE